MTDAILIEKRCSIDDCPNQRLVLNPQAMCSTHYWRWRKYGDPRKLTKAEKGASLKWLKAHVPYEGDECLIWPFGRYSDGYGQISHNGRKQIASRLMCEMVYGPPSGSSLVCAHSCGRGHMGCVNPNHLRWATSLENRQDSIFHGTANRGEKHGIAKTTKAQVLEMRRRYANKQATQQQLADEFGLHNVTVSSIIRRATWAWLDDEGKSHSHS